MTLQVIQQAAIGYIFSHYVYRVSLWAHSIEFYQLGMVEFPGKNRFSKFSTEFPHSIFQMSWKRITHRVLFLLTSPLLLEQRRGGKCFGSYSGSISLWRWEMLPYIGHRQPQKQFSSCGCCVQLSYRESGKQWSDGILRTSTTNLEKATP